MKPLAATIWAYPQRPLEESPLWQSCRHYQVPLLVLQQGEPWVDLYHNKVARFFEEVRELDFDLFLWVDADDAFLTGNPWPGVAAALEHYETDFLVGAEVLLWPWGRRLNGCFPQAARCNYANTGGWAATRAGLFREFQAMIDFAQHDTEGYAEDGHTLQNNDQALLQAWMASGKARMALDHQELLVLNLPYLNLTDKALFLDLVNNRLPPIVHGPGIAKGQVRNLWSRRQHLLDLARQSRYDLGGEIPGRPFAFNCTQGLTEMLAELPPLRHITEVGCYKGVSTEVLALFADQVTAVDLWDDEGILRLFRERLAGYGNVQPMRLSSVAAASNIPDKSLDLVYIDADHSYEAVRQDISAWLPKVKPGGFLTGHDYMLRGVVKAVDERFGKPDRVYPDGSWLIQV